MENNTSKLVGINHIALEVGNVDEALDFYGQIFSFELRGRHGSMAFIDLGDQFIALAEGRTQTPDEGRHFGLVVESKDAVCKRLAELNIDLIPNLPEGFLDFLDPWGNHIQIVEYGTIQFTKTPAVLNAMGLGHLKKSPDAEEELREKGMWSE